MRIFYDCLEEFPYFYFLLTKLKYFFGNKNYYNKIVHCESHIYIDGFPRSSNSFTRKIIRFLNTNLNVTGHFHSHAHTLISLKYKIPSVILIRKPFDAILSIITFKLYNSYSIYEKFPNSIKFVYVNLLYFYWSLRYYRYYSIILLNKHKLHVVRFSDITSNTLNTLHTLDSKFNLNLNFDKFNEVYKSISNSSPEYVLPSDNRDSIKLCLNYHLLNHQSYFYMKSCNTLYQKLT